MSGKRYCSHCGNEVPEGAKFCRYCGNPMPVRNDIAAGEKEKPEGKNTKAAKKAYNEKKSRNRVIVAALLVAAVVTSIGVTNIWNHRGETVVAAEKSDTEEEFAEERAVADTVDQEDAAAEPSAVEEAAIETTADETPAQEVSVQEETVSGAKEMNPESSTPEAYVAYVYENYMISEVDAEGIWDNCISDRSKGFGISDKDTYVDNLVNAVNLNGLDYLSYEITNSEELGDGVYKIDGSLKYVYSGEQNTDEVTDYVAIEGDQYKVILNGITDKCTYFAESDNGALAVPSADIYYCADGSIQMVCTLENHTAGGISLGWVDGSQVEIQLDNGETCYSTMAYPVKMNAGESAEITLSFENVNADISKMIIHSVNILDSRGLPETFDGGASYTYTFNNTI